MMITLLVIHTKDALKQFLFNNNLWRITLKKLRDKQEFLDTRLCLQMAKKVGVTMVKQSMLIWQLNRGDIIFTFVVSGSKDSKTFHTFNLLNNIQAPEAT